MKDMGSFAYFSFFLSELWSLNSLKSAFFCTFELTLAKKSKPIKVTYICTPERSRYAVPENGIVYYVMIYRFGDIMV